MARASVTAVLTAGAMLALAGCGGQDADVAAVPAPAPTVTATVTVTATPSSTSGAAPDALSKRQAGKVYDAMFRPWNDTAAKIIDAELESSNPSLAELTGYADRMAALNLKVMKTIQRTAWPMNVRADINKLYREQSAYQGLFEAMAERAESVDEFYGIYMKAVDKSHTGTSERIRIALGIKD